MLVAVDDMVGRDMLEPVACCLVITLEAFCVVALKDCDVKVGWVELEDIDKILPCHVYGSLLEIVAKGPVAEHLEHSMVVGVVSHFLKVVVLAADAQTLLRVGTAAWLRVACAENDVFPLVHSGVCEHQCGVVFDNHWRTWHNGMSF